MIDREKYVISKKQKQKNFINFIPQKKMAKNDEKKKCTRSLAI